MSRIGARRWALIAAAGLGCTAAGALAGMDAASHVSGFYTVPITPRSPTVAVKPVAQSSGDWATSDTYPVMPPAGSVSGGEVGREEQAFFDTGVHNDWSDAAPRARVRRGSAPRVVPTEVVQEQAPETDPASDPVEEQSVGPPPPAPEQDDLTPPV